ncbi:creatininase family protein [Lichenihabitans sp. Uapishka_5]|uniref:creatininase family protein n=1 Tax=Lichenihabitans sp. Uapishka_5 TaxID=3037302 RepID=UPI0029E7CBED|nr:creatininase family protein [Lichenihabitans sp. Uapishka_5]MDX7949993.1 creatininase family protein [Lichenihabitans sp. Uapishka_5]
MVASKFWMDWAWPDFAAADLGNTIAVLPVAAVEQHGPHLPVGVDTFIMEGYLRRVAATMPDDLPVLFLPVQPIGKSNEHVAFPGTLTLSAATVIRAWTEIGESVHRAGIRKLLLLNSHGGNVTSLDIVARDLRVSHGMLVATASWHRFGYPETVAGPVERTHGIHAGEVETSLMLAFRPDLVRRDKSEDFRPDSMAIEREFKWLRVTQPVGFGWTAQDNSPSGAMGNAAAATVEKGEQAADYGAAAFVELIRDMAAFDLARLRPGPLGTATS